MSPSVYDISDEEGKDRAEAAILSPEDEPQFPDGGFRAWMVVVGAYLVLFSTFGVVNSYGVFQDYYASNLLTTSSPSIISLIGSLQLFLLYGLSPIIGRLFDVYGTSVLMPLGTLLTVFSMMMLSLAGEGQAYQFFLCQGVLFGVGNAVVFTPSLAVIGHWFSRRRAYAIGIAASGSALGGVVYPIMIQHLFASVGFAWAVRIAGFVTFVCLAFSCITIRTRLPLSRKVSLRDAVDLDGFRDLKYTLTAVGVFLSYYALFIPFYYIEVYANFQGVPPTLAKYLISMVNALGIPARVLPGLLADRLGPLNVLAPSIFLCGILSVSLWLPSRGSASITVFAALYGLFSGAAISLLPSYIATISPIEKFGARLGSVFTVAAVATLAGTPTAGAFLREVDQSHFDSLIIFTGILVLVGGVFFGLARLVHSRRVWVKI